jgi:hypothetical protein
MAGGIDWFRWHHGSVTDPKFQLVAKRAGVRLGDVIAVWAFVLEKASSNLERGQIGFIDFETLDFLLSVEEGVSAKILDAMTARGLIVGSCIARWEERQPKKEDDTAADRKRRQREREHELEMEKQVSTHSVTPKESHQSHAMSRSVTLGHDREEKRREEKKEHSEAKASGVPPAPKDEKQELYAAGKSLLELRGMPKAQCGSFITKLAKDYGQEVALDAVRASVQAQPLEATEYLIATCQRLKGERKDTGPPITVPSKAADDTARLLATQAAHAAQAVTGASVAVRAAEIKAKLARVA